MAEVQIVKTTQPNQCVATPPPPPSPLRAALSRRRIPAEAQTREQRALMESGTEDKPRTADGIALGVGEGSVEINAVLENLTSAGCRGCRWYLAWATANCMAV